MIGAVLLTDVYAPLDSELQDVVRSAVFPALALTGIAMSQAPRIRRISRRFRSLPAGARQTRNHRKEWTDATPRAR